MAQHGRRQRPVKSLRRSAGKRPERRTIMVFCEGVNSEPDYINSLKRLPHISTNNALELQIHPGQGVPLTLVERAVGYLGEPEIDELWCVFDVEWPRHHPHLNDAIQLARSKGIHLAISNPCFELWLILHHRDQNSFVATDAAEHLSRKIDGRSGKAIDGDTYMPLRKEACRRARNLEKRHARDDTRFPNDNPSSGMFKFLASLEGEQ